MKNKNLKSVFKRSILRHYYYFLGRIKFWFQHKQAEHQNTPVVKKLELSSLYQTKEKSNPKTNNYKLFAKQNKPQAKTILHAPIERELIQNLSIITRKMHESLVFSMRCT